jgi:hypothetical protein
MRHTNRRTFGYRKSSYTLLICAALLDPIDVGATPNFGQQSSTKHVEWGFDFVEEFDGLQNWRPDYGAEGSVGDESKMPKLASGEPGPWGYYSIWSDATPPQDWIGNYGDNRVWRGTKSAAIDLGGVRGPSRFGLYFFPGYEEFYLFFMVNIPKHQWPTSCEGGSCSGGAPLGTYEEGKAYAWYASWKFLTFNIGCEYDDCWQEGSPKGYSPTWHFVTHVKKHNYGEAPGLKLRVEPHGYADEYDQWADSAGVSLDHVGPNGLGYFGDWFGIEYHIKQEGRRVTQNIWVYDQDGNATKVGDDLIFETPAETEGKKWDFFFIGGNNSESWSWGPTMQPTAYYIDDFIIDDNRIGPKYFALINGETPEPPAEPLEIPAGLEVLPGDI